LMFILSSWQRLTSSSASATKELCLQQAMVDLECEAKSKLSIRRQASNDEKHLIVLPVQTDWLARWQPWSRSYWPRTRTIGCCWRWIIGIQHSGPTGPQIFETYEGSADQMAHCFIRVVWGSN
jgi:hypothetical protein